MYYKKYEKFYSLKPKNLEIFKFLKKKSFIFNFLYFYNIKKIYKIYEK